MGTVAGHKPRDRITSDSLVPAEKHGSKNKVRHCDLIHVDVAASRCH